MKKAPPLGRACRGKERSLKLSGVQNGSGGMLGKTTHHKNAKKIRKKAGMLTMRRGSVRIDRE